MRERPGDTFVTMVEKANFLNAFFPTRPSHRDATTAKGSCARANCYPRNLAELDF